jgi:TM2 domain-containing membrane protein YozV
MSTALTRSSRQVPVAYGLLALGLFGFCGLHRLYAGRWVSGLIWLFTGGLCGLGQLVDILFVPRMIEDHNEGRPVW